MRVRGIHRKYIGLSWITLVLSLVCMVSLLIPIQQRVETGMQEVKAVLMSQFEEELGIQLFYDSISPSIFQFIEIRNVQVVNKEDQRTLLSIDRFRIHYSLLDLLFKPSDSMGTTISIHRANVYVDLIDKPYILELFTNTEERAEYEPPATITQTQDGIVFTLPSEETKTFSNAISLHITQSFVTLFQGDQSLTTEIRSASTFFENNSIHVQLHGIVQAYELGNPLFASDLTITGQTANLFETFMSTITLKELEYDTISIQDQSFQVYREGSVIQASIIESSTPLDLSVKYYIQEELLEANIATELLDITDLFTLEESNIPDSLITTSLNVVYSIPRQNLFYQGTLEAMVNDILISGEVQGNNWVVTAKELAITYENLQGSYAGTIDIEQYGLDGILTLYDTTTQTQVVVDTKLQNQWNQYNISITQGSMKIPEISGALYLDIPESSVLVDIEFLNHFYQLSGSFKTSELIISGRGTTHIQGLIDTQQAQPFSLIVEKLPVPLSANGTETGYVSLNAGGVIGGDSGIFAQIANLEFEAFDTIVRAQGSYEDAVVQVKHLSIDLGEKQFTGEGNLAIDPEGDITLGGVMDFMFSDALEDELYSIELGGTLKNLHTMVRLPVVPVNRLLPNTQGRGHFHAMGSISGSLEDPTFDLSITSEGAQIGKNLITGNLTAHGTLNEISLYSSKLSYGNSTLRNFSLLGTLEDMALMAEAKVTSHFSGAPLTGDLHLSMVSGSDSIAKIFDSSLQGELSFSEFFLAGDRFPDIDLGLFSYNNTYHIVGGPESSIMATITQNGEFSAHLTETFPVGGTISGYIRDGEILLTTQGLSADMAILNYLQIDDLAFYNGRAYGSLTISGSLQNPDWNGYLTASKHTATIQYIPEVMEVSDVLFTMSGKDAVLHPFVVDVGKHRATLEGGFNLDGLVFQEFYLDIKADPNTGMAFSYPFDTLGLRVDGVVYGDFGIFSSGAVLDLYGDIRAQRTTVSLLEKTEVSTSSSGGNADSILNVDLKVTMGRDVKFLWPDESFPILLAVVAPESELNIFVDGRNQKSLVTGDLKVRGGEIYYLQRSFYITSGSIVFNENESRFDPVLTAEAKLRDVDASGERVDIYLSVPESPLSTFSPSFTSTPLMSEQEIIGILAGNFLPTNMDGNRNLISAVSSVADLGFRQIEQVNSLVKTVREALNLDILTIRTQFIQNLVLYQYSYFFGQQEQSAPLITLLDNTTITLGKTVTTNLYVQALFRVTTGASSFTSTSQYDTLHFETELGVEWDTPFFLFSLSIQPNLLEPKSLLENTYCGASWRFIL